MKYKNNDRVVYKNNVSVGGTVVGDNPRFSSILGYISQYQVLWDNSNVITDHSPDYLYPESITMTANRQPDLRERIERLERVNNRLADWAEKIANRFS